MTVRYSLVTRLRARAGRHILLVAAAATAALGAVAQAPEDQVRQLGDLNIKELMELEVDSVFAASRYLQRSERAPSSTTVITADEIKRFGARTLADVLNSVRGMYAPSDRNYTYLGIRGFQRPNDYNTRVLVLVDGHRMNDNVFDLGAVGRDTIDVDLIERVEVIRGPSSSIYGSSAFLGVINVVTKRGTRFDGFEATAGAATYGAYDTRMTFGTSFDNGVEWLISGSRYSSEGPDRLYYPEFDQRISTDPRATNDGIAAGIDGENATNFYSSVRFRELTFSAYRNARIKEVPTASYGTVFNDPRLETSDYREYLDMRYDRRLTNDLTLQARVFYDEYSYDGVYPFDFAAPGSPPDVVLNRDGALGRWVGTEALLTVGVGDRHTLIVGGEYRDNLRENMDSYYDLDPRDYTVLVQRTSSTLGVFAQSESNLTEDLSLTAGIRYDRFDVGGDTINPRFALVYSLDDTATLKAMYGEAFRTANPYERYYFANQAQFGGLNPETIETYEVAYEKKLTPQATFVATTYVYHVRNLVSQASDASGALYFANLDSAKAEGVEFEFNRRFDAGIGIRASYALQRAHDENSGTELSSSPNHLAKLNIGVPLRRDTLSAGFELQYHGSTTTTRGASADDFVLSNVTLLGKPTASLDLSVSIYNLFDARYGYPGGGDHLQQVIELDGRTLLGRLAYRF
jgi:outer membrane receptor for ferrienterochelin and colicins